MQEWNELQNDVKRSVKNKSNNNDKNNNMKAMRRPIELCTSIYLIYTHIYVCLWNIEAWN